MTTRQWLGQRVATDVRLTVLCAAGSLCGALVLLFLTFVLCYAVVGLAVGWLAPLSDTVQIVLALALVGSLFWGNARTSDNYLAKLSVTSGTGAGEMTQTNVPGIGRASTVNPLAPDSAQAFVKLLTAVLYIGPRAVHLGIALFAKAKRLREMDLDGCAAVITLLYSRNGRWTYLELEQKVPQLPWNLILHQLRDVDGIIFHTSEPPGLSLADRVRDELRLMAL